MTNGTNKGYLDLNQLQVVRRPNSRKSIIRKIAKFVSFFLILYFFSGCQKDFFCYSQSSVIDFHYKPKDKIEHFEGERSEKGNLVVEWETR